MSECLVVIDMQNDYFVGGAMELVGIDEAASNAAKVIAKFRADGKPIIHIQHLSSREGATFFIPSTTGCEINDAVKPTKGETVVQKAFPSSFQGTTLENELEKLGVKELVICGAMTHMCIDTTVRSAFERGYTSTLIADACATCDLEYNGTVVPAVQVQSAFLAAIGAVFAKVVSTAEYMV